MDKLEIFQPGESVPFSFTLKDETASIDGWVCTISLKQLPADVAILSRVVAPTDQVWTGFLTQTETVGLATGLYYLHAKLTKASTDEEQVKEKRFRITEGWT
jgi:hypothetical protein